MGESQSRTPNFLVADQSSACVSRYARPRYLHLIMAIAGRALVSFDLISVVARNNAHALTYTEIETVPGAERMDPSHFYLSDQYN